MKKEVNKMLKVIYYDENAAIDYVTIANDGNLTVEEINKAITDGKVEISSEAEISAKTSLLKMLNLSLGVKSNATAGTSNEKVVNSTITTNTMTEFIKLADSDDNIEKINNVELNVDEDTATYIKSVFPYLSLMKNVENIDELKEININKVDEVLLSTKGYFEFIAFKDGEEFAILRFNIECFRNNYKFNDLLMMNLFYYGIKVGYTRIENIKFENQIKQKKVVLTEDDINVDKEQENNNLPIYDIIIAGVKNV